MSIPREWLWAKLCLSCSLCQLGEFWHWAEEGRRLLAPPAWLCAPCNGIRHIFSPKGVSSCAKPSHLHHGLFAEKWVGLSAFCSQFWDAVRCQGSGVDGEHTQPCTPPGHPNGWVMGSGSAGLPCCHDNCSIPAWQGQIFTIPTSALPGRRHRQRPCPEPQLWVPQAAPQAHGRAQGAIYACS